MQVEKGGLLCLVKAWRGKKKGRQGKVGWWLCGQVSNGSSDSKSKAGNTSAAIGMRRRRTEAHLRWRLRCENRTGGVWRKQMLVFCADACLKRLQFCSTGLKTCSCRSCLWWCTEEMQARCRCRCRRYAFNVVEVRVNQVCAMCCGRQGCPSAEWFLKILAVVGGRFPIPQPLPIPNHKNGAGNTIGTARTHTRDLLLTE